MHRFWITAVCACMLVGSASAADVLQRIEETGKFRIGYRADAPPFSFRNNIGEPSGYTVDLCRAVAARLGQRLERPLSVVYVPVTAQSRFEAIADSRIDLLCGATTETLSRRKLVDFSVATFVTGASVIFRADGPHNFRAMNGRKIGVTRGTTTERYLRTTLKELSVTANVVDYKHHADGLKGLQSGAIDAYFGDRAILTALMSAASNSLVRMSLSDRYFSIEPYALAMPRGNERFRNEVDRALSRIYKSGALKKIYRNTFGNSEPSELMKALIVINALPN